MFSNLEAPGVSVSVSCECEDDEVSKDLRTEASTCLVPSPCTSQACVPADARPPMMLQSDAVDRKKKQAIRKKPTSPL